MHIAGGLLPSTGVQKRVSAKSKFQTKANKQTSMNKQKCTFGIQEKTVRLVFAEISLYTVYNQWQDSYLHLAVINE